MKTKKVEKKLLKAEKKLLRELNQSLDDSDYPNVESLVASYRGLLIAIQNRSHLIK